MRTVIDYAEERSIYKELIVMCLQTISKNNGRQNSATEYYNADRTTWKLTFFLQDINTTSKELKTERDCSHRAHQYGVKYREKGSAGR